MEGLEKLLEDTRDALENMEECVSHLMDKAVVDSTNHFKEERRWESLLYPHLDLSFLDPFKVVLNGELVDEE